MYWYYKYPLIIILVALLFGTGVYIWRSSVSAYFAKRGEKQIAVQTDAPDGDAAGTAVTGESTTEKASTNLNESKTPKQTKIEPTKTTPTVMPQNVAEGLKQAKAALEADNPKAARELAYSMLTEEFCKKYDTTWYALADIINQANSIFMNGKAPCPEKDTYIIKSGDNLTKIAYRNNTTVQALQRMNNLPDTTSTVHPGQALQFIKGNWSIMVSKSQFLLELYLDEKLYRIYRISTGRQDRTPACTFVINQKLMYPAWTYNGKSIPYGDPENILGSRWIGLKPIDEDKLGYTGYGIHGTTEPEKIGTAASLGCVRMLNEEVEELYDFIPSSFANLNITVTIVE